MVRGRPPEFFQGDARAFTDLYFDVRSETFEFYGPVKMRDDPLWVSVTELFRSDLADVVKHVADHSDDWEAVIRYRLPSEPPSRPPRDRPWTSARRSLRAGHAGAACLRERRLGQRWRGSFPNVDVQQRILFWYVHSFLWGRYSGTTETRLQRDLSALEQAGVDGLIAELELWRGSLEVRPDDFASSSIGARFYPLLYILTRVNEARDLCYGFHLSHGMIGSHSKLHVHHVFPKKRLYNSGYYRSQVNSLANFCLLTAECNQALGARHPRDYFPAVEKENPGVLRSQWIPDDDALWSIDRYPDFLAARRTLLAEAANELLSRLRSGEHAAGPQIAAPCPDPPASGPVQRSSRTVDDVDEAEIVGVVLLADQLGIAAPETHCEISDSESGEVLAVVDVAWTQGVQPGRTEPVALLLAPDSDCRGASWVSWDTASSRPDRGSCGTSRNCSASTSTATRSSARSTQHPTTRRNRDLD